MIKDLETAIGYRFRDIMLLQNALAQKQMVAQADAARHGGQGLLADHVRTHPGQFTLRTVRKGLV